MMPILDLNYPIEITCDDDFPDELMEAKTMFAYKQHPVYRNYYFGPDGSYLFYSRRLKRWNRPSFGTKMKNAKGYPTQVAICLGSRKDPDTGKKKMIVKNIGRLVLEAHGILQDTDNNGILRTEVDHIDRNPYNNELMNLRWATPSENKKNRDHSHNIEVHKKIAKEHGFDSWGQYMNSFRKYHLREKDNA